MSTKQRRRKRSDTHIQGGSGNSTPTGNGSNPGDDFATDLLPDNNRTALKFIASYAYVAQSDRLGRVSISNPGSGYSATDVLTLAGGTGSSSTVTVGTVDAAGTIKTVSITAVGAYTANPANLNTPTGGGGTGAILNCAFEDITSDTITRGSGSFVTDGWAVGDIIRITGTASNNFLVQLLTVVALTLTCVVRAGGSTLVDEASVSSTLEKASNSVPGDNPGQDPTL